MKEHPNYPSNYMSFRWIQISPQFLYPFFSFCHHLHLHRTISDSEDRAFNYKNSHSTSQQEFRFCRRINYSLRDVHSLLLLSLLHSISMLTTLSTSSIVDALCAIFVTSLRSLLFSFLRTETAICIATSGFTCSFCATDLSASSLNCSSGYSRRYIAKNLDSKGGRSVSSVFAVANTVTVIFFSI